MSEMKFDPMLFAMNGKEMLMDENDLGIINGKVTTNGRYKDVAAIYGLYAPLLFSDNFSLNIRFAGRRIKADQFCWFPNEIRRSGEWDALTFQSELVLGADRRMMILKMTIENHAPVSREIPVQYEISGGLTHTHNWEFSWPRGAGGTDTRWENNIVKLTSGSHAIMVASDLAGMEFRSYANLLDGKITLYGGEIRTFYTAIAIDKSTEAEKSIRMILENPEKAIQSGRDHFAARAQDLLDKMPQLTSSSDDLNRLYYRSLMHFLLNQWQVPEFKLHPYFSTGSINGGAVCCYLWDYGAPYKLWGMYSPESNKEHIKTFLGLDLTRCFAFYPSYGDPFGPWYYVNQEKIIMLVYYHVLHCGDTAFLHEFYKGKRIIDHVIEQALLKDDLSRDAVLVDYGSGNHHLELRRSYRYDNYLPDMNLRRCVYYHLADRLCHLAGVTPEVDFIARAEALKKLIREKMWDPEAKWFRYIDIEGNKILRHTIQMFKPVGWSHWALDEDVEEALLSHLNEAEFLGEYGMHSMSKLDPAYDQVDIDNGGGGSYVSFPPAIADRLYQSGRGELAENIFKRLLWMGRYLPYWGDSQTANMMEYRRDTPLQNDIAGVTLAQSIIFGMFGIKVLENFSIEINPCPPKFAPQMKLSNIILAKRRFDVEVQKDHYVIREKGQEEKQASIGVPTVI